MKITKLFSLFMVLFVVTTGCKKDKTEDDGGGGSSGLIKQIDIAKVDNSLNSFMTKYSIPGASLAFTNNGKLVYRKGYGLADKEANEKVTIDHRFRLASVSKTYTATAILKLVEAGKFSLDNKVFGEGALLGTKYGTTPYSANLSNITVSHLLKNISGGWGGNSGGDPIDQNPQMNNDDFFSWVLKNKPVKYAPNTRYDYSNMNFFIAGRIIEKFSGKPYATYIKEMVNAVGDRNLDVAGPALADRKPKEVKYYGNASDAPYVYVIALTRRDADGGLMTTATDLLRFITSIDGSNTRPDIISAASLKAMTTGSGADPLNNGYGLGTGISGNLIYNYGSLPGTRTAFMRSTNGKAIALLLNSRQDSNPNFANDMQTVIMDILNDGSISWQDLDQF